MSRDWGQEDPLGKGSGGFLGELHNGEVGRFQGHEGGILLTPEGPGPHHGREAVGLDVKTVLTPELRTQVRAGVGRHSLHLQAAFLSKPSRHLQSVPEQPGGLPRQGRGEQVSRHQLPAARTNGQSCGNWGRGAAETIHQCSLCWGCWEMPGDGVPGALMGQGAWRLS